MIDVDINVFSMNTNGLGDKVKRTAVIKKLKRKGPGIFLLQEAHSTKRTECFWRHEWGNKKVFFSHGLSNSRGVIILFSDEVCDLDDITEVRTDTEGRFIIIDVVINKICYTIGNLYAPTRDHEQSQTETFYAFCCELENFKRDNVILGGDFNLYMNPRMDKLDTMSDTSDNNNYRQEILSYMETYKMIDIWRVLNPDKRVFTWHRGNSRSRLDYFIVSEHLLNCVSNIEILPGVHSDHCLLQAYFKTGNVQTKGRGFWKFNSSLLHDHDYTSSIKDIIKNSSIKNNSLEDKGLLWELVKLDIRSFTLNYSARKHKENIGLEKNLNSRYIELNRLIMEGNQDESIIKKFYLVKSELEIFEKQRAKGAIIRSKALWTEEGEQNSSYFLRLEKNNYCNKLISQLNIEGKIITDATEILDEEKRFYENLYTKKINEETKKFQENCNLFTKNPKIPKISETQKESCDEPISESELLASLKKFKNGKSPGTTGLTAEFYKFFWNDIKALLTESLNYALKLGELSIEQKRGIITLIPKKDKDRLMLKNWRPITLLNIDYKILAKALSNRLTKLMPLLIEDDQTGYISGRFIGTNIRIIEDIIVLTDTRNQPGILLIIDFEKAFDSISWKFIDESLESYNFGKNFRHYIKTLYKNAATAVINNGNISEWFNPERGVRQGCPISPYLFLLCVELLAISIRTNDNIKGITINNIEIKISQLADDTSCVVEDLTSMGHVLDTFEKFKDCAGLKVNVEKTKARFLGSLKTCKDRPFDLDWTCDDEITLLGINIAIGNNDQYILNFKKRLKTLKSLLFSWKGRNLSLKGKVTVINSLALSPLLYAASVIHVPQQVIKEVKDMVNNFLWDGKIPRIAYCTLIQDIEKGGLKLTDFESKIKSLKITWIKRLLDKSDSKWKAAPSIFYNTQDFNFFFRCNRTPIENKNIPLFYRDIHKFWSELHTINDTDVALIKNQILWNNRYITIGKEPFIWKTWYNHNILTINDILDDKGKLLNQNDISTKYNLTTNFLSCLQLRQAIPFNWKQALAACSDGNQIIDPIMNSCFIKYGDNLYPLDDIANKMIYMSFISQLGREPTCINNWKIDYPQTNITWQEMFYIPYTCIRETKLQSFQYKIIHRIVECNKKLFDMKIKPTPECSYCQEIDTIQHFFLYCPKSNAFWKSLTSWLNNNIEGSMIVIDEIDIILGHLSIGDKYNVINYCILYAKYYIYKQRLFYNNDINLYEFLMVLKDKLKTEYNICKSNEMMHKFLKKK
jgi:exonuclease III